VRDLDCTLLFHLACGVHCVVLDAGSAREDGVSRAVWQGLAFVRYVLSRRWLGAPPAAHADASAPQFARHARALSEISTRKLDYFKKFVCTPAIRLSAVAAASLHDGDDAHYAMLATRVGLCPAATADRPPPDLPGPVGPAQPPEIQPVATQYTEG